MPKTGPLDFTLTPEVKAGFAAYPGHISEFTPTLVLHLKFLLLHIIEGLLVPLAPSGAASIPRH